MKKFERAIVTLIAMAVILCVAGVIYKYQGYQNAVKFESDRVARVDEVTVTTDDLKSQIAEISTMSVEQIAEYINENAYVDTPLPGDNKVEEIVFASDEKEDTKSSEAPYDPWAKVVADSFEPAEEEQSDDTIDMDDLRAMGQNLDLYEKDENDSNDAHSEDVNLDATDDSDNLKDEDSLDNEDSKDSDSEGDDWEAGDSKQNVSRVADLGYDAVKNMSSEDVKTVSEAAKENHNLGDSVGGEELTLQDRQELRTSAEETELWIEADREVVSDTSLDFSDKKIACLGDSVTEAANLLEVPDYEQYTYPTRLKEILNCEEMTNLGIGGSSYGRYWADAFCDRYQAIPKDTDIIIVFGGYNDGYCLHEDMIGSMDNRDPQTLYGAVNDLMKGLTEDYPNAEIVFMTPLPNLLHDVLRKERPELLSQTVIVDCVKSLAEEYGIDIIDAYNANFMDSHDADIVASYIPDSVHPNEEGYEVLAEHVAAELIRIMEEKDTEDEVSPSPSPSEKANIFNKIFNKDNNEEKAESDKESEEVSESPAKSKRPLPSSEPSTSPKDDEDAKYTPSSSPVDDENSDEENSDSEDNSESESPVPKWTPGSKTVVIDRNEE